VRAARSLKFEAAFFCWKSEISGTLRGEVRFRIAKTGAAEIKVKGKLRI
jgi:hypothetical protein